MCQTVGDALNFKVLAFMLPPLDNYKILKLELVREKDIPPTLLQYEVCHRKQIHIHATRLKVIDAIK